MTFYVLGIPRGDNQSTGDLGTGHPKNCDSAHHVLIIILFSKYFGKCSVLGNTDKLMADIHSSDEGLTLETSAFKLSTVANLRFQLG